MADTQVSPDPSADVLAVVHASPRLVGEHDKAGWLGIFTDDAVIEDPVGSVPARKGETIRKGDDELGRFWETFIAPNRIVFESHLDVQAGGAVARDVTIHTRLPNGFEIGVGAHLLYEVESAGGEARVRRMRAFWEMSSTSRQGLQGGLKGMIALMGFFWRIIRLQGLGWTWRYCRALYRGIRGRGPKALRAFAEAATSGDADRLRALFDDPDAACIDKNGQAMTPADLAGAWSTGVALFATKPRATGFFATATVTLASGGQERPGILFLGFSPRSRRICEARLFTTG